MNHLVSEGVPFEEAKRQAQSEVLDVFNLNRDETESSERLSIHTEGEDNAALLAVSSILQGYRSEAEVSELLARMTSELEKNGDLESGSLGSELINHAVYLNPDGIKENLEKHYGQLDVEVNVPDFDHHLEHFTNNTDFEITERLIDYPPEGEHGVNVLDPELSQFTLARSNADNEMSLAAELEEGTSLRVKISTLEGSPQFMEGMWVYEITTPVNWDVKQYNDGEHSQEFVSLESGRASDLQFRFVEPGVFLIEYFEMDTEAEEPAWSRELEVAREDDFNGFKLSSQEVAE